MMDGDPIDEAVRAYQVPAPAPDLAARVARQILAGDEGAGTARGPQDRSRRLRRVFSAVAMFAAAAAVAAPSILFLRSEAGVRAGASAPADRETLSLGGRATLVA
jgi:hypothetical protein